MNFKNFLSFYGVFVQIWLSIVVIALMIDKDYFLNNKTIYILVNAAILTIPLLVVLIANQTPALAKWIRIFVFNTFSVKTFASASLIVLLVFTGSFVYNMLVMNSFMVEQIFLNVLVLDLVFLFFISLTLTGRFQINDPKGLLLKAESQEEIYLYKDSELRHIPDPPTLRFLGFSFNDVQSVSTQEFSKYTIRPQLESVVTGKIIQGDKKPEIYMIMGDEKRHIPDPYTLQYILQLGKRDVSTLPEIDVAKWPTGTPLRTILDM